MVAGREASPQDVNNTERTCGWCATPIDHMKPIAKYCCRLHKDNANSKRHRERNPGYFTKYNDTPARIAWREANREHLRRYAREYQSNLPDRAERSKAWREANREYFVTRERKRQALKINNPGSVGVSERDWVKLCRRYNYCCAYCGQSDGGMEMDHVIPLTKGGRHAIGNILPACGWCNRSKNAAYHIVWKYRKAYRLLGKSLEH